MNAKGTISKSAVRGSLLALALCVPMARALAQQEEPDTVALKDGKTVQGSIKDEDFAGVTVDEGGKTRSVSWDEVQSVAFGDVQDLGPALSALGANKIEEAAGTLEQLAGEKLRSPVQQEVLFHLGWALQRRGDLDAAVESYRKLLTTHPHGRYLRLATENLVACMATKGNEGEVAAELDKLAGAAGDAKNEVELVRAHLDEARNRYDDAKKVYTALQGDARPAIAAEAKLGLARAALREDKKSDAEAVFRQVISAAAPATVLAGAWNGLGELMAVDGKARRDSEKLLDAAYAYLRGVVQYKPRLGESTAEYERALAGTARCFKYISELENVAERKKLYAGRAQERLNQLRAEFPQSIYLDEKQGK